MTNDFFPFDYDDAMNAVSDEPEQTMRERILDYICDYATEKRSTPNQNQIAKHFERHYMTIQTHLDKLQKEGRIVIDPETRTLIVPRSVWRLRTPRS